MNAVVTGGNKGIGFEICRQLASNGVTVVLTARDEKRGLEAVEKLRDYGLSHLIVFHQLDVTDPASVASLADFIKTKFGKLDILVNNAAICGVKLNPDALTKALERFGGWPQREQANWDEIAAQTFEMAEECLNTNYYGAKRTVETLIPLLQLSDSARIVNVSASLGSLKYIPNEEVKGVLNDVENLTEDTIDELLNKFLKDFEEKSLEKGGWPTHFSAYTISKTFMNAYARILAKKHPNFLVNSVCPGYVKTDINYLALIEFACNNSYQSSIGMASYEALYGRKCRTPICWDEVGERRLIGPEIVQDTTEKANMIRERLKIASDRQKSYADNRRRDLKFEVGDQVFLRVSPGKGILRFGKHGKLSPRYIGPYEIVDKMGEVAYRLRLPSELANIHDVFHVSMLRKYIVDPSHILQEQPVQLKENLTYEEHPVEILDRRDQVLRNKVIPLVKVLWRNHELEEATWEPEAQMRAQYTQLFE